MALSARLLPGFGRLPKVIQYEIQAYYLPVVVKDLHASIQVSKAWRSAIHKEQLWKDALANEKDEKKQNKLHDQLICFLITAIQEKQYDRIYRYIAIGAKINRRYSE